MPSTSIFASQLDGENFLFRGTPNDNGFLAKLVTECVGASYIDAYRKASRARSPAISHWSLTLDIPISIFQTDVKELLTGGARMTFTPPYPVAAFAMIPMGPFPTELRGYASVYREALLSNSPLYQFLCYFKIIENVRALRDRLAPARQAAGLSLKRPFERIPADKVTLIPWLESIFLIRPPKWDDMTIDSILLPEGAGKTFSYIIEGVFSDLRHGIAHALFEGGELTVSIDDQVKLRSFIDGCHWRDAWLGEC
jgi:hypothetical protein